MKNLEDIQNKNLAKQSHWDEAYERLDFFKPRGFDPIKRIIKKYFQPANGKKTVFEIGCFPGRYLSVFGDLGFILNGVDLTPRVEQELPLWLAENRYRLGQFFRGDFLNFTASQNYDVVCSFGFIEHFTNFKDIIKKQLALVAPGGQVVITTPNFSGSIQHILHSAFDKENLGRHHLPAMDPFVWKEILEHEGFEVEFCGWQGGFDFWAESKGNNFVGKTIVKLLNLSGKILRFFPFNHKTFSPYAVVVARRRDGNK